MSFFKTFSFRIMAIAFVGTHIPLLTVVFYFVLGPGKTHTTFEIITVTLMATLAAAMGTLLFVDKEVRPVRKAALSLVGVEAGQETPDMPATPSIELQQLFTAIQESYASAQELTEQKQKVAQKLTRQADAADHTRNQMEALMNNLTLNVNERQGMYKDLHSSASSQIEIMRSIIAEMGGTLPQQPQPLAKAA